jgi:hypothetical protein
MVIDKSKIYMIQSHEWGGQIVLESFGNKIIGSPQGQLVNNLFTITKRSNSDLLLFNRYFFTFLPITNSLQNGFYYLITCNAMEEDEPTFTTFEIVLWNTQTQQFYFETYNAGNVYNTKFNIISIPSYNYMNEPNSQNGPTVFALNFFIDGESTSNKYLGLDTPTSLYANVISVNSIQHRRQLWYLRKIKINKKLND